MNKNLIIYSFMVFLVILGLFFYSSGSTHSPNVLIPEENGGVFIKLTGLSMYPVIKDGDVKQCEVQDSYEKGDVVTFIKNNKVVSHRIVGEVSEKYITKGDNNVFPDLFLVDKESVVCKVIY